MKCGDIKKFVHIYLDNEMSGEEAREFSAHLAECECCRKSVDLDRAVIRTIRERAPRYHAPADLRMAITAAAGAPQPFLESLLGWARGRRGLVIAAAAVIAAVAVGVYLVPSGGRAPALRPESAPAHEVSHEAVIASGAGPGGGAQARPAAGALERRGSAGLDHAVRMMTVVDRENLRLKSLRQRTGAQGFRRVYLVRQGLKLGGRELADMEMDSQMVVAPAVFENYGFNLADQ
jgi:anti-sigma factor (TIGR02949 family)